MSQYYRTYAEIDLAAIRHNINEVKKRITPDIKLCVVIKADAYGHGAVAVAKALEEDASYYALATLDEALELRAAGITTPLLILGYVSPSQFADVVAGEITLECDNLFAAEKLNEEAIRQGKLAKVHLALDTGMTRIGFHMDEVAVNEAVQISKLSNVEIEGMFTHFSCADQEDKTYCQLQLSRFNHFGEMLEEKGVTVPIRHICNSAGIMEFDDQRFAMVRSGIITYGLYPSEEVQKERMDLIPALSWKAHVVHIQDVPAGVGVSYGATFVTKEPVTRIATVSIGYADGYPRALSSKGHVLIHGQKAPILGRVCMDQMMVDISSIDKVEIEDLVTLVGRDGDACITIEEIADPCARFNYEMVCNITKRVTRVYKD